MEGCFSKTDGLAMFMNLSFWRVFGLNVFLFLEGDSPNLSQWNASQTPNLRTQNPRNALCHPLCWSAQNATSKAGLAALIESVGSVEAAGEAIYSTLFEAAPSVSVHNGSLDGDI